MQDDRAADLEEIGVPVGILDSPREGEPSSVTPVPPKKTKPSAFLIQ
jgi:hypothetical protein